MDTSAMNNVRGKTLKFDMDHLLQSTEHLYSTYMLNMYTGAMASQDTETVRW